MTVRKDPRVYRTYLFTIWEERSPHPATDSVWRYRLEDPHSGVNYLFATLQEVVQFLEEIQRSSKRGNGDEQQ